MRKPLYLKTLAASLALLLAGLAQPVLADDTAPAQDLGATNAAQTMNVTLILKARQPAELESFIYRTVTPGDPLFHRFLSTSDFAQRFGASDGDIAQVKAALKRFGITVDQVLPNHLAIVTTGTADQYNNFMQTQMHEYQGHGRHFRRPYRSPILPTDLQSIVAATVGLSTEAHYQSHRVQAPFKLSGSALANTLAKPASGHANSTSSGVPGEFTVGDVADRYNINPLYSAGISGKGATIGIVTLADFVPADAQAYWDMIGLKTKPNRITQVHVDGGGPLGGGDVGSGGTSLDVEQSGGLAPQADILVYDAPNTSSGFIDVFYQAVSDNKADSLSVSWGGTELGYLDSLLDGNQDRSGELLAFHQIFMEAAAQGISVFASTGDSGAFDTVRSLGHTDFSAPLTIEEPASDPYITAAGGTTVPYTFSFFGGPQSSVAKEQVWGWDYLQTYLNNLEPGQFDLFSTGGGGGVSIFWPTPVYQLFTRGIQRTQPGQALIAQNPSESLGLPQTTPLTLINLPANFHGRNVPDVSLNADPETGYVEVSSLDGGLVEGDGGTSFVAPQLNGIAALLTQSTHHRVGFLNPQLYGLQNLFGYGAFSAFNDVNTGDNWFYQGAKGYEPGAGLGTLNVANLDLLLRSGL